MSDIIDLIYADHDWLRRQFFRLDDATSHDELAAIWTTLSARLDAHADAEETVFYPALLKHGGGDDDPGNPEGDPRDETEDAITDHNAIRDAVRKSRSTSRVPRSGSRLSSLRAKRTVSTSTRRSARPCRTSSRARAWSCATRWA